MYEERIVSSRPDREIWKKLVTPGDYSIVPYEDARCKIILSDISCTKNGDNREIEAESRIFSSSFDGNVLIGDSDSFLDKDLELVLQQMCCGETCEARILYRDGHNELVKEIKCSIALKEVTEEQLISDWGWVRLYETAIAHKERGVELVKQNKIPDAFRKFNKALKLLIAIEPINPESNIDVESAKQIMDTKVKLYNNMAHCQLQYNEYDAAIQLCNSSLRHQKSAKAIYRRAVSYMRLKRYEEAWKDIQAVLELDPNDKAALQRALELKPMVEKMNNDYSAVIKNMFR